ncbi:MAG: hypothetical protein OS112_04610 [Methanoregula sp.]|nr:MAG: hypothetical protein OS112_04610 [Methanoregula sp.]
MPDLNERIWNNYAVIILVIALLFAAGEIVLKKTGVPETVLVYIVLFSVGIQGILAGFMHWYRPAADKIARKIGWQPGSPFQKEVAAADAAFGILGVISFFLRDNFLVATVIGSSFMLFFMGIGHILDIRKNKNISPYNAGVVVYFDILLPVAMLVLLAVWKSGS